MQTIKHGNSLELIKQIPSESINLAIIDPFFDIKPGDFQVVIDEVLRTLHPTGTAYFFSDWKNLFRFQAELEKTDLELLNLITWSRMSPGTNKKTYKNGREDVLWYVKDKKNYTFNKQFRKITGKQVTPYKNSDGSPRGWFYDETTGERTRWAEVSNVWCYTRPVWSAEEFTEHGMQKPLQLCDRIILTSSNEGDTVLDMFSGSGSFLVSAKRLNRKAIGFEQESKWVSLIENRLNSAFELKNT